MPCAYRSIHEAWLAFDAYARLDPQLRPLWDLCRTAAPPARAADYGEDAYGADPFDSDAFAAVTPDDDWCSEDFFREHVKQELMLLVGSCRPGEPHALHSREAYETLYDLLLNWALNRTCTCCAPHDDDHGATWDREDHAPPAYR